jgi:hypothetical protein
MRDDRNRAKPGAGTLDDEIGRHIADAAASGELATAASYGKPFAEDEGWHETPAALRMPMKILKDAGVTPPEIAWFHARADLRARFAAATDAADRQRLAQALADLEQKIALRLEALRINANL